MIDFQCGGHRRFRVLSESRSVVREKHRCDQKRRSHGQNQFGITVPDRSPRLVHFSTVKNSVLVVLVSSKSIAPYVRGHSSLINSQRRNRLSRWRLTDRDMREGGERRTQSLCVVSMREMKGGSNHQ